MSDHLRFGYICPMCLGRLETQGFVVHRVPNTPPEWECDSCGGERPCSKYEWQERPALQRQPGPSEFKEFEHGTQTD